MSLVSHLPSQRRACALGTLAHAVSVCLLAGAALPASARSGAPEFSEGFLLGGEAIDMARYANGNPLPAGDYAVDVHVNGQFLRSQDIAFAIGQDPHVAVPCIPVSLVRLLPLKPEYLDALPGDAAACVDLPERVEGARVAFDSGTLELSISLPQAAQASTARGFVAPELRDDGITAAFVNYSGNHYRSQGRDSSYLGLNAGVNAGAWRLRHRASFTHSERGSNYNVISSHVQRDIPAWNSQLLLGQGNTGGELFDSVAFTGVRVASDDRMLPDSLRGYAPKVQGIAEGAARVTIRQNGNIIHESNVAPGPFSIEDLYPTSFSGDLEVTVTEADGREQRFNVNFSAVPQALRAGASRFAFTTGELRDNQRTLQPLRFAEGTYARGISNGLTLLGGAQVGQRYQSLLSGAAINTRIGAFGVDVTHSRANLAAGERMSGNSFRVNYQRYVQATGTNFGLAAYRYSTRDFLSLNDTARVLGGGAVDEWGYGFRARERYQLNFSQKLGERATLHLSGGQVAYWDSSRSRNDLQLSVQTSTRRVNYGLSALRYQQGDGRQDTRYAFTLSVPLGRTHHAPRLSTQLSHAGSGDQAQATLTGNLGESRALSYTLSTTQGSGQGSHSAYAAWQGGRGHVDAGYSRVGNYSSLSLGASGSVVLHGGGINLGAPVGDGFALVQASGAQGARVGSSHGVRVASNGYALVPHISPYRWNTLDLDPSGLPMEVELLQTSQRVAPTAGGIVRVPFEVRRERTLFIDATDALGQPLPFAAQVHSEDGRALGAVGQGGVIQLRGAQDTGALIVDPEGTARCRIEYRMPDAPDAYGLSWNVGVCVPQRLAAASAAL
ncbi:fimbria/pilus outer membrane usher protein [Stenotrophomonas sp. B1-1]|uniref:fimbria/pilus outer membrane usher protein n=1 Tax=Stenotrophomonas sp. B1-1 TaxID=2710648 RepID=UPI0013D8E16C|nr:fimbria/pilus outer membrane usher protein [Stenotrophomonas sp. B1-1]